MRWQDPRQEALAAANRARFYGGRSPTVAWLSILRIAVAAAVIAAALAWMTFHAT